MGSVSPGSGVPESDRLFGVLVVEQGITTQDKVDECLSTLSRLLEGGVSPRPTLGEMLIRKGYLSPSQFQATLRVSQKPAGTPAGSPQTSHEPVLPPEYGHSVGEWQGDTLVVNTTGLEERAWLDRPGHPKSLQARIEERYTRLDANSMELLMTLYDPENYTAPWKATRRVFTLQSEESYTFFGWKGVFSGITESICAPMNEVDGYNNRFRNPGAGIQ